MGSATEKKPQPRYSTKKCTVCGKKFVAAARQVWCSESCTEIAVSRVGQRAGCPSEQEIHERAIACRFTGPTAADPQGCVFLGYMDESEADDEERALRAEEAHRRKIGGLGGPRMGAVITNR